MNELRNIIRRYEKKRKARKGTGRKGVREKERKNVRKIEIK